MANFAIDPLRFLPTDIGVEDGGEDRISRTHVSLLGNHAQNHEEYLVAIDGEEEINPQEYHVFIPQVKDYI